VFEGDDETDNNPDCVCVNVLDKLGDIDPVSETDTHTEEDEVRLSDDDPLFVCEDVELLDA